MKPIEAVQCEGCGEIVAASFAHLHDEGKCLREKENLAAQYAAFWEKVRNVQQLSLEVAVAHRTEILEAFGKPKTALFCEPVREFVRELLQDHVDDSLGIDSSYILEDIYTEMIQTAVPEYVF